VLGPKWVETIPLIHLLALAMPFMTLQILFAPANNALGHAEVTVRNAIGGALIMPLCFLIGIRNGTHGMVIAWLFAFPALTLLTIVQSQRVIGFAFTDLARSVLPGLLGSAAMALIVGSIDLALPALEPQPRLAILVLAGIATYAALLLLFARSLVDEVARLLRGRAPPAAPARAAS
jgi:O-antigen/teichoic acid export membrane protein